MYWGAGDKLAWASTADRSVQMAASGAIKRCIIKCLQQLLAAKWPPRESRPSSPAIRSSRSIVDLATAFDPEVDAGASNDNGVRIDD